MLNFGRREIFRYGGRNIQIIIKIIIIIIIIINYLAMAYICNLWITYISYISHNSTGLIQPSTLGISLTVIPKISSYVHHLQKRLSIASSNQGSGRSVPRRDWRKPPDGVRGLFRPINKSASGQLSSIFARTKSKLFCALWPYCEERGSRCSLDPQNARPPILIVAPYPPPSLILVPGGLNLYLT